MSGAIARFVVLVLPIMMLACTSQTVPTAPGAVAGSMAHDAQAEPGVFLFHDCVGPEGTPASFTAVKTELPAAALPAFSQATGYRLTDGSATFIALIRSNRHHPPGIDHSDIASVTCLVDTPLLGTVSFSGFLTR